MGNPNSPEIWWGEDNGCREIERSPTQVTSTIYYAQMVLLFMKGCQRNPAESFSCPIIWRNERSCGCKQYRSAGCDQCCSSGVRIKYLF